MPQQLVTVKGFRELQRLYALADKESKKEMKTLERELAKPVQVDAEATAGTRITRIRPDWAEMRIGITQKLIYVAPKKRGVKPGSPRSRRKFATLMNARVMEPVAERWRPQLVQRTERLFNSIARRWGSV